MSEPIVISGLGLCTPLGTNPVAAIHSGRTGVRLSQDLKGLPDERAAVVDSVDLRRWLKRRKDKKLMARASQLALAAAGPALCEWPGDRSELGLFLGVGREPGDDGESASALLAAQSDLRVNEAAVAGPCRDVYPPLLPLKTLPNMVLAHVSIHLDICGENGAWSGQQGAGMAALRAGWWAVQEGRCPAALVGAADSCVDAGSVRDRFRQPPGQVPKSVPGEAGVMMLIEPASSVTARGASGYATMVLGPPGVDVRRVQHHEHLGDCGAADGALALALGILQRSGRWTVSCADAGQPAQSITVSVDDTCAWYAPPIEGAVG